MNNPLKGQRIEYHILQSFPVTCLNRDDVGSPKSAFIGGVQRGRVSSQCWKRQVRMALHDLGVRTGIRTKNVEKLLYDALIEAGATEAQAMECAAPVAAALTDNTLFFFTQSEARGIANFAKEHGFDPAALVAQKGKKDDAKAKKAALTGELKKELKSWLNTPLDGLDIALFGRMAAQAPEMNMQAAVCFAHAITTHECVNEIDFFTALDDLGGDEPGSAHMGTLEFNSGTYYRYISLDLGLLSENLGGENLGEAVKNFTLALYKAVPAARQTTQSGLRPWDYGRVLVRQGQGMQASFDEPVKSKSGYLAPSRQKLDEQLERQKKIAGELYGEIADYTLGEENCEDINKLADSLAAYAANGGMR